MHTVFNKKATTYGAGATNPGAAVNHGICTVIQLLVVMVDHRCERINWWYAEICYGEVIELNVVRCASLCLSLQVKRVRLCRRQQA